MLPPPNPRCDASRSMRANALACPHPSRRAYSNLLNVFFIRAPQDEDKQACQSGSQCQTASLLRSRGAFFAPGLLHRCFAHPNRGWAERRETFGCSGTRGTCAHASKTRVNALMTRDARLSALHRGDFELRGRASLTGIRAGSVTANSSHPGRSAWRRLPEPPGASGYEPPPQDATRHSAFRIVSRTRPQ